MKKTYSQLIKTLSNLRHVLCFLRHQYQLPAGIEIPELRHDSLLKGSIGYVDISNRRADTVNSPGLDKWFRRGLQERAYLPDIGRGQQTGPVVEGSQPCQFVGGSGNLQRPRISRRWDVPEYNIMTLVHKRPVHSEPAQSPNHHFGMFVSIECQRWAYHTIIDISLVVENRSSPRSPTDELDAERIIPEQPQIDFEPRILISPNYYARAVRIQEQHSRIRRCFLQEVMFDGEI